MKNDIKTNSTDFLPPKPGDNTNSPSATATPSDSDSQAAPPATDQPSPAGPTMPTSAHVIDLKSQAGKEPTKPETSSDFMAKNNPFLKHATSEPAKPEPTSVNVKTEAIKPEDQMPEPPKPEVEKPPLAPTDTPVEPKTPPTMDLAHPKPGEPDSQNDLLKDAMVTEDNKEAKPKKKIPTWLLVIIIVVAVIAIAIGTFAVLNIVARPTGI